MVWHCLTTVHDARPKAIHTSIYFGIQRVHAQHYMAGNVQFHFHTHSRPATATATESASKHNLTTHHFFLLFSSKSFPAFSSHTLTLQPWSSYSVRLLNRIGYGCAFRDLEAFYTPICRYHFSSRLLYLLCSRCTRCNLTTRAPYTHRPDDRQWIEPAMLPMPMLFCMHETYFWMNGVRCEQTRKCEMCECLGWMMGGGGGGDEAAIKTSGCALSKGSAHSVEWFWRKHNQEDDSGPEQKN